MQRRTKKILIGLVAVLVLAVGAFYAYVLFIKEDAPAALDSGDLDAALTTTTAVDGTAAESAVPGTGAAPADGVDGEWNAVADGSTLGYRVDEVLGGVDTQAAGRTDQITGSITISGTQVTAGQFTVDMASITSDESRRDGQFRGRIMAVDQFPTSTFALTAPIDFGAVPANGTTITTSATGDLTLHGVTRSVTFEVQAKLDGGRVGVLGSIPVKFSDYDIPDPSNGIAKVKDNGLLEFVIVFVKG